MFQNCSCSCLVNKAPATAAGPEAYKNSNAASSAGSQPGHQTAQQHTAGGKHGNTGLWAALGTPHGSLPAWMTRRNIQQRPHQEKVNIHIHALSHPQSRARNRIPHKMTASHARANRKLTQEHTHKHTYKHTFLTSSSPNLFTDMGLQISKCCALFGEFLVSHISNRK